MPVLSLAVLLSLAAAPCRVDARWCACVPIGTGQPPAAAARARRAAADVVAIVVASDQPASDPVRLRVERWWRGAPPPVLRVYTGAQTSCWVTFTPGERYLLYARRRSDGRLQVDQCSGTRPTREAAADLASLGRGHAPRGARRAP